MKTDAPSSTANIVARNIALIAASKETFHLVSKDAAKLNALLIKSFSRSGKIFLERTKKNWFQTLFRFYERITIPGLALHQALRKFQIESAVRESLAEGFRQVVILGGGLDTLAMRLCREFPRAVFIELDHPATQRIKRQTIEKHNLSVKNLKLLPMDLTNQTLEENLIGCPDYQPRVKTVFICEGVLMYLEKEEVDGIFNFISRRESRNNRFIFTFMEPDKNGQTNFRNSTFLVRLWLDWKKEPFKWGINLNELTQFLAAYRFSLINLTTPETFRQLYFKQFGLENYVIAQGENICVCESAN